jgi:hypothetical protein
VRLRAKSRRLLRLAGLNHRENIPGRIFEPGDGGTIPAHDPFLVGLNVRQIINLKTHAALCEFIDRLIHIMNREIKDGELGRSMISLRINENITAAGKMQRQQAIRFRNLEPSVRP